MKHLGEKSTAVREIAGLGAVNHVFVVALASGEPWVVRFCRDPLDDGHYAEEAWCLRTASHHGIAVPQFVTTGTLDSIPFIVQSFVEGENADAHRSPGLWRRLGRYSRIINGIPLDSSSPIGLFGRFGRDPKSSWLSHTRYNLDQLTADDPLIPLEIYRYSQQPLIRSAIEQLRERLEKFGLTHGDLVPRNIILPPKGEPTLIDWGSACVGPVPFHDYLRIWADEDEGFLSQDLEAFAQGYGIPSEELLGTMANIELLVQIDRVRWARDRRPDRLTEIVAKSRRVVQRALQP